MKTTSDDIFHYGLATRNVAADCEGPGAVSKAGKHLRAWGHKVDAETMKQHKQQWRRNQNSDVAILLRFSKFAGTSDWFL